MQPSKPALLSLLLATVAATGCSEAANRPSEPRLEGTYSAASFTVATPDTIVDQIAEGAALTITLHSNGTTSGTLTDATGVTDLGGQWDTVAGTLHLHLGTPTFLTHIPFLIGTDTLVGEFLAPPATFHLTLAK